MKDKNYKLQKAPFGYVLNTCGDFLETEVTETTESSRFTNHHSTTHPSTLLLPGRALIEAKKEVI